MGPSAVFIILFVIFVLCVYKLLTRHNNFFRRRGVEFEKPTLFFGNLFRVFLDGESEVSVIEYLYEKFSREKLFGIFILSRPLFVVKDVELLKQIVINDFDNFANYAGNEFDGAFDGLFQKSLTFLQVAAGSCSHETNNNGSGSHDWRDMRNMLNKIFTKSSVKTQHRNFLGCANNFLNQLERRNSNRNCLLIDTKEDFGKFLAGSIAASILSDSCEAKISEVHQITKLIESDLLNCNGSIKLLLSSLLPKLFSTKIFRLEIHEFFFKNLTQEVHRRRSRTKTNMHDMIQLMTDALSGNPMMNDESISAQFLIFFTGGFRSTLKLLQSCFSELATNQTVQRELTDEIDAINKSSHGGSVKCDAVINMKFLDMVINETLRKYPPIPFGTRICTKYCTIATSSGELLKFIKGDEIHLPFKLLQHDAKYYTNPQLFDPHRFNSDESKNSLLAFGLGPRSCIGSQFVLLQSKVVIFTLLSKYSVKTSDKNSCENFCLELNARQ